MKKLILTGLFALLLFPLVSFASFDTSLKYGSSGTSVSSLQDFLQDQGDYKGKIDGRFGLGTLRAVETFQTANSLKPDGYFGIASRGVANTLLTAEIQPSNDAEQAETGTITTPTVDGCTGTTGYSTSTGHPCDGSTVTPQTNDTGTQSAINSLTGQVQALTQKVQQQTIIQQQIEQNTTPIATTPNPVVQSPNMEPISHAYDLTLEFGDPTNPYTDVLVYGDPLKGSEVMFSITDNGLLTSDIGTTGKILATITSDTPQYWDQKNIYISGVQDGSNPFLKDGFNVDSNGTQTPVKYLFVETGYAPQTDYATMPNGTYTSTISIPALGISKKFNIKIDNTQ